jgi:hypothetical protein
MIKLRRKEQKETNYFKLRYGYFFAITGILASIGLLLSSELSEFTDVLITVIVGLILYALYKLFSKKEKANI